MPEKHAPTSIRVIVLREDDTWVAQCLEYDIGAQANDLKTLRIRLNATIAAEVEESVRQHGRPFAGISPAPDCYSHMWHESVGENPPQKVDVHVENSPDVEYELAMCA